MGAPTGQDSRTAGLRRTDPGKRGRKCHVSGGVLSYPAMPHRDTDSRRHSINKSPQVGATSVPIHLGCMHKFCVCPLKCMHESVYIKQQHRKE